MYRGFVSLNIVDPWGFNGIEIYVWPPTDTPTDKLHGHSSIKVNGEYLSVWPPNTYEEAQGKGAQTTKNVDIDSRREGNPN